LKEEVAELKEVEEPASSIAITASVDQLRPVEEEVDRLKLAVDTMITRNMTLVDYERRLLRGWRKM